MTSINGRRVAMHAVLAMGIHAGALADVPSYSSFTLQVRSNIVDGFNLPNGSSFNSSTPAINDAGDVAVKILVVGDTGRSGMWLGSEGAGAVVYQAPPKLLLENPSINTHGELAFEMFDIFTFGIFVYDPVAGSAALAVPPGGAFGFDIVSNAHINDTGVIGFRAGTFGNQWYMTDDDGVQTQYVVESGSPYGFLFTPDFNNANQIAGKVRVGGTAGDLPDQIRRFESDGSSVVLVADVDGDPLSPFASFDNGLSLANNGSVAFAANLVTGGRGVFRADETGVTTIATTSPFLISAIEFFAPSMNENGLVAFRAKDIGGNDTVYVGDGVDLVRLVGEHDVLPTDLGPGRIDQHDNSVTFGGAVAINNGGDVAFIATLTPPGNDQIEWGSGVFVAEANVAACPADLDGSGDVGFGDILAIIAAWGVCPPGGPCPADLSGNLVVDFADILALIALWGPCP